MSGAAYAYPHLPIHTDVTQLLQAFAGRRPAQEPALEIRVELNSRSAYHQALGPLEREHSASKHGRPFGSSAHAVDRSLQVSGKARTELLEGSRCYSVRFSPLRSVELARIGRRFRTFLVDVSQKANRRGKWEMQSHAQCCILGHAITFVRYSRAF